MCKKPVWLKDLTHNTVLANLVAHYRLIERDVIGAACRDPKSDDHLEPNSPTSTVHSSPQQPPSQLPAARSPCRSPSLSPPPELATSGGREERPVARDGDTHDDSPRTEGDDVNEEAQWGFGEAHVPDSQECQELREENMELEEAIRDIDHLLARAPSPYIEAVTAPTHSHAAAEGAPVTPATAGSAGARRNPNSTLRTVLSLLQQGHAMASLTSAQLRLAYRCGRQTLSHARSVPACTRRSLFGFEFRNHVHDPTCSISVRCLVPGQQPSREWRVLGVL